MIIIGFDQHVPGEGDGFRDLMAALAPTPWLTQAPYPHCYLGLGNETDGFYRIDCYGVGVRFEHSSAPEGLVHKGGLQFRIPQEPELEAQAFARVFNPWTQANAHASIDHILRLYTELQVQPNFRTGEFACTSFVLWSLRHNFALPHRTTALIEALEKNYRAENSDTYDLTSMVLDEELSIPGAQLFTRDIDMGNDDELEHVYLDAQGREISRRVGSAPAPAPEKPKRIITVDEFRPAIRERAREEAKEQADEDEKRRLLQEETKKIVEQARRDREARLALRKAQQTSREAAQQRRIEKAKRKYTRSV